MILKYFQLIPLIIIAVLIGCSDKHTHNDEVKTQKDRKFLFENYSPRQPEGNTGWLANGQPICVDSDTIEKQMWSEPVKSAGNKVISPMLINAREGLFYKTFSNDIIPGPKHVDCSFPDSVWQDLSKSTYVLNALFYGHWVTVVVEIARKGEKKATVEFYDSLGAGNLVTERYRGLHELFLAKVRKNFGDFQIIEKIHALPYQIGASCWLHAFNIALQRMEGATFEEFSAYYQSPTVLSSRDIEGLRRANVAAAHGEWIYERLFRRLKFVLTSPTDTWPAGEYEDGDGDFSWELRQLDPLDHAFLESLRVDILADHSDKFVAYALTKGVDESTARARLSEYEIIEPLTKCSLGL